MRISFKMSTAGSDWEDITSESEESVTPDEEEERGPEASGGQENRGEFYGGNNELLPYQDEPEADEAWIARYEQELAEELARNMELEERLDGRREISSWSVNHILFYVQCSLIFHARFIRRALRFVGHTDKRP